MNLFPDDPNKDKCGYYPCHRCGKYVGVEGCIHCYEKDKEVKKQKMQGVPVNIYDYPVLIDALLLWYEQAYEEQIGMD